MIIVYKYTCRVTRKVYVGKTAKELRERHLDHCSRARIGIKRPFYNAIRKYGIDAFDLETLLEIDSEYGNFVEILFIAALKATDRRYGYNVSDGGEGVLGVKLSAKAIANLRAIAKTRKRPEYTIEHRNALRKAAIGNTKALGNKLSLEVLEARYTKSQERTRCRRGHEVTPESVYIHTQGGKEYKQCRECRRELRRSRHKGRPTKAKGFNLPGWKNGGNLAKLQASRTPAERSAQASNAAKIGAAKRAAKKLL